MTRSGASYSLLAWNGSPEGNSIWKRVSRSPTTAWKDVVLVILVILTSGLSIVIIHQRAKLESIAFQYPALDINSGKYIQNYKWWSGYSSPHHSGSPAVDQAWGAIVPAHGIVAVDHQWAAGKRLPDTMSLPSDRSKRVYIIDAYHQLHCLTIVRKTFYELSRGEPLTYPAGHSTHCFDNFRQYIQCTAGDTLLYSWGLNTTGDGQQRQCRDWTALRDWATEHTACYRDSEKPIPLLEHFGHCDNKTDGLKVH